ncbi:MAG: hypothetical protein FWB72_05240 [Firmicutes bacterium]|nr:hypothetical protein [Bacillota bacterium]
MLQNVFTPRTDLLRDGGVFRMQSFGCPICLTEQEVRIGIGSRLAVPCSTCGKQLVIRSEKDVLHIAVHEKPIKKKG